ncbi:MAG: CHASE2 domain-containing protein, partial [Opitutaceae bacterium]
MGQLKKKFNRAAVRWLALLPIPVVWCVLSHFGALDFFENRTIDWRFRKRGELSAPIKVIYVDIDSRSTSEIGNWQWSRQFFADVTDALVNRAGVSAIGFDILLLPKAPAQIADLDMMRTGDVALGRLVFKLPPAIPPPVVFAASFAADEFRAPEGKIVHRGLPLVGRESRNVSTIEPPEQSALQTPSGAALSPPFLGLIDTMHAGTRTVAAWTPSRTREFNHMAIELARL